jgi:hypothetical protein
VSEDDFRAKYLEDHSEDPPKPNHSCDGVSAITKGKAFTAEEVC